MKRLCNLASGLVWGLLFSSTVMAGAGKDILYSIVQEGEELLIRDEEDKIYTAVIYDKAGLMEFQYFYPVKLDLPRDFFKQKILIVGFSDSSWAVTVDGFQQKGDSSYYYLDLADKGIEKKIAPPPAGKKYTAYCVISIENGLPISHVQIREGLAGLCQQYKTGWGK